MSNPSLTTSGKRAQATSVNAGAWLWLVALACVCLSACGAAVLLRPEDAQSVVLPVRFTLVADRDLNPDTQGLAKPVLLRIYELKTAAAFERASFQELMEKDEALLGSDFVRREELVVLPGETRTLERKGNAEVRVFGVFVAYRHLEQGVWRTTVAAPGSAELRRSWMGLGRHEKAHPVNYRIALSSATVRLQVQLPGTALGDPSLETTEPDVRPDATSPQAHLPKIKPPTVTLGKDSIQVIPPQISR